MYIECKFNVRLVLTNNKNHVFQESTGEVRPENFYDCDDSDKENDEEAPKKKPYVMDPDHRLLLRTCKPLLNSRNAAVCTILVHGNK